MAKSRLVKIQKRLFYVIYNVGAAIVVLGALGKILHMPVFGIPGSTLLMIGLGVEAAIFFLSAFEPMEEELDWSIVYPELAGGEANANKGKMSIAQEAEESKAMLSQKLDNMLREAKLDVGLMKNLSSSIQSFSGAAQQIQPAVNSIAATNKYSEQLSLATTQMESLNSLYKLQMESASKQAKANEDMVKNTAILKDQMQSMSANLQNLNQVYGGMLSAMTRR